MKINEKNLISFAVSQTPVDREGWLQKRGDVHKSFQKRWFALRGNLLFYFDKRTDREPIGVIILEGCTIELEENETAFTFKIVFHGAGHRTYVLCANTQEDMEGWMKAIACASYDYMKLMVAELQRQLDEIGEAERLARVGGMTVNRSDSCLCVATKNERYNPFNRWKDNPQQERECCATPAVADTLPPSAKNHRQQGGTLPVSHSTKRSFLEMHLHFGQQFQQCFEDQRKKHLEGYKEGGFKDNMFDF